MTMFAGWAPGEVVGRRVDRPPLLAGLPVEAIHDTGGVGEVDRVAGHEGRGIDAVGGAETHGVLGLRDSRGDRSPIGYDQRTFPSGREL